MAPTLTVDQALLLIEGYRNAIQQQKDTYDTSGIRNLCANSPQPPDPRLVTALNQLITAIDAYRYDVNSSLALLYA